MFKFVLTLLCAVAALGLGFAVTHSFAAGKPAATADKPTVVAAAEDPNEGIGCPACNHANDDADETPVALAATAPATQPAPNAALIDVKNTKCIVTGEDVGDETFTYDGKIYHVCCGDCVKEFKKDPQKYLKALAADPAKFGIK